MDDDLLQLYRQGIKSLDDIKEDYAARLAARVYKPEEVMQKTGLLCLRLTREYFRVHHHIADHEDDATKKKFMKRELDNNYNIGSFIIDDNNRKFLIPTAEVILTNIEITLFRVSLLQQLTIKLRPFTTFISSDIAVLN